MHSPGIKASSWPLVRRNIESKTNGGIVMSQEKKESGERTAETPKKVYATPTFIKYGSVSQLTQHGAMSVRSDSGHNHMRP